MFDNMTIKEIAEICHCSTRTLRYYEEIGLLKPSRMENNYRTYSFDAVSRVEMILMLKKTGMRLDQIRKELSDHRNYGQILKTQKRLLEEERQRISQRLCFIENQQRMLELYHEHGLKHLFFDVSFCADCEIVRIIDKKEIVVRMEYDELFMAIEDREEADVYLVRRKPAGEGKRIAAAFFEGEHRIRHRQRIFRELLAKHGCVSKSLIYSEGCCLMEESGIYFMWCEVAA